MAQQTSELVVCPDFCSTGMAMSTSCLVGSGEASPPRDILFWRLHCGFAAVQPPENGGTSGVDSRALDFDMALDLQGKSWI